MTHLCRTPGRLAAALTMLLVLACAGRSPARAAPQDLVSAIEQSRALKDSMFRHSDDSPLLPEDRAGFTGLVYYPVNPAFRVPGKFHRYARLRQIRIPDSNGTTMFVERLGRFHFQWDGKPFWLEVVGSTRGEDQTVYFTDLTNGITTYPAGRYAPVSRDPDGTYLIDFNEAYNPYCVYNPAYICPLPPAQNRLRFHVEAGEMLPGPDLAH